VICQVTEILHTPNPHAIRFMTDRIFEGNALSFYSPVEAGNHPLARRIFALPGIECVFLSGNCVAVTKNAAHAWNHLIEDIRDAIESVTWPEATTSATIADFAKLSARAQLAAIESVIDHDIRPGLALDGGGMTLISFADNTLTVRYQGACHGCPSATNGTLPYIEKVLRAKVSAGITVVQES
jgi:Fe-S cluster biogenesis protein NfuA